ncbi:AraC family transcriptional regulator [Pseudoduganella sp. LjRoot289]|uniref:helix-turn-helix domain-containing protein n=1 Tax=Pseudoduganella sp. LjRoot289 TaxID=3342314 RepID=UPI003ED0C5CE
MQEFYKKALLALVLLVVADALFAAFFVSRSYLTVKLLQADQSGMHWQYAAYVDASHGGTSLVRIDETKGERLRFGLKLTNVATYPFASAVMVPVDGKGRPVLADWSMYSTITFLAKCAPSNSMVFAISTFDEKVSRLGEFETYRSPATYYSCNSHGVPVSLDMTRLTIPDWWFYNMKLDLTRQGYQLDKVGRLLFGTSSNSPREMDTQVEISELTLRGRDYRYIAALAVILLAGFIAFGVWFFRAHSRALIASLDSRLKKDLALVAYRQLTLEPYKDKEKASVLRFIATNYTNTELDLERVVAETGANRNKVNELLKTELGMTFTSYLNKLRLTEAARLLAEKSNAAVAEIAYSVGYGNVSYFNRLFKEEYGCTPKAFRTLATQQEPPPGCEAGLPVPPADAPR